MTNHLPECLEIDPSETETCICVHLRACEKRVRSEYAAVALESTSDYHRWIVNSVLDAAGEAAAAEYSKVFDERAGRPSMSETLNAIEALKGDGNV